MCFLVICMYGWASLVAQVVKNSPAMQGLQVWPLGWEDPLKMGMSTHSNIFSWRIPWPEEPGIYSPWCPKELDMTEWLTPTFYHVWLQLLRIFFLIWTYLISNTETSAPLSDFLFLTVLCIVHLHVIVSTLGKLFNFYVPCLLIWQMGIIIVPTSENCFED